MHFSSSPWILSFLFISMRGKEGKVFKTYREFCVHLQVDTFDILELRLEGGDGCLKSIKKEMKIQNILFSYITFSWANNLDLFRDLPRAQDQKRMHCHALNNARSKRSKQYALICTAFKNKFNTTSERGKESFSCKPHISSLNFISSPRIVEKDWETTSQLH